MTFEGTGTRQVRATAVGRGTHGVPDIRRIVESQFHIAFPHRVWVSGEVGAPYDADDGLRFALHPSTGDDPFSLPCLVPDDGLAAVRALLHRTHDADLEDVVREGRLARAGGLLRFEAARGSVVLVVSELDPTPTAMEIETAREAALLQVVEARLTQRQRALPVRTAPLEVAVVAAPDQVEQARELLASSRYDVVLAAHPVVLTGKDAPTVLAGAVRAASGTGDMVLLLRQEGRPLGLATYDALDVAEAVADSPVPVVTGLGGGGVRTAADEVAWTALPTAQDALGWLLERLEDAELALDELVTEVAEEVQDAGDRCRSALAQLRSEVDEAGESAVSRAQQVRRRRRLTLQVACAVLAVAVGVAALVTGQELLLLALLVPLLALVGTELWWRSPTRRRTALMSTRDDDFTQVLTRLRAVRDELRTTTSPERVAVLRELAAGLARDGEKLLGVHLTSEPADEPAPAAAEAPAAPASAPSAGEPRPAAVEAVPADRGAAQETVAVERPVDAPTVVGPPLSDSSGQTSVLVRPPDAPDPR